MTDEGVLHRSQRLLIAAVSAAVLAAATVIGMRPHRMTIVPGTVVLDVQTSELMTLNYLSSGTALTARRAAPGEPFDILAGPAGAQAKCRSSPDLSGLLPQLARTIARRQLTLQQALTEFPIELGTLQLEDRIRVEPMPLVTVRARQDRSAIAFTYDKVAVETETAAAVFQKLGVGCAALAAE